MAIRSGPWAELRASATYAENETWYQADNDFVMGKNANCVHLFVEATGGSPGAMCFYLQTSDNGVDWYDFCRPNSDKKLFGAIIFDAAGKKSVELTGLNMPPLQKIRVFFQAMDGAGVVSLSISVLAFESGIQPVECALPDFHTRIALGLEPRYSWIYKFGDNQDIGTATTPEDVWQFGGEYNFSATADIDTVSSSSALDVGQSIAIVGQDINNVEITQVITTNGQNKVTLATPLYRVYRMLNLSSTPLEGVFYCYVDGAITSGKPDDDSTVRAIIDDGDNQTQMAIYTVPAGYIGHILDAFVTFSRTSLSASSATVTFRNRRPNETFRVQTRASLVSSGTSVFIFKPSIPVGPLPAGTDLKLTVEDVSANGTGISGTFTVLLERIK
jgi:hypothetical protein